MPKRKRFSLAERRIVDVKTNLSRISRQRLLAYREGPPEEAISHQFRLLEAELRNVEALAEYVGTVSPAAARELTGHLTIAASRFREVRAASDMFALQDYLKKELVPLVNKSEQAALLVATALRQARRKKTTPFAWKPGTEE